MSSFLKDGVLVGGSLRNWSNKYQYKAYGKVMDAAISSASLIMGCSQTYSGSVMLCSGLAMVSQNDVSLRFGGGHTLVEPDRDGNRRECVRPRQNMSNVEAVYPREFQ